MILRSLAALALLTIAASASAQTVINSLPYTITTSGKYVIGQNLQFPFGNAYPITITAPNVILDLNGFYVSGPNSDTSSFSVILVYDVSNVTIRNGTIARNSYGITMIGGANSSNHLIENVNITKCLQRAITIGTAPGTIVRNNSISNIGNYNSQTGTTPADAIVTGGGVSIENNLIVNVTGQGGAIGCGIRASATDFVVGNRVSNCTFGIIMEGGGKFLNNLTSNCATPFQGGVNATGNN